MITMLPSKPTESIRTFLTPDQKPTLWIYSLSGEGGYISLLWVWLCEPILSGPRIPDQLEPGLLRFQWPQKAWSILYCINDIQLTSICTREHDHLLAVISGPLVLPFPLFIQTPECSSLGAISPATKVSMLFKWSFAHKYKLRIPWMEGPGGQRPMGVTKSRTRLSD